MYIRSLTVKNLKRLRDFSLDFTRDGEPRMWTVLIGENGTGKTSILQAIALAAAGPQATELAGTAVTHLRDRRQRSKLSIEADFAFTPYSLEEPELHSLLKPPLPPGLALSSSVFLDPKEAVLRTSAVYSDASGTVHVTPVDPLDRARARNSRLWFVIGYGVHRTLPESGRVPDLTRASVFRMKPLFGEALTSTSFMSHFGSRQAKARVYSNVLKRAIINTGVLPSDVANLELRGYGGVSKAADLLERDRFQQTMGPDTVKVPGLGLAHGHQSTIAWVADLVGHILLEADTEIAPEDFEGLVLIDEIDLYLHPTWQANLIPALRKTFPKLQFVATTHSPVVLASVPPEEVVRLKAEPDTGNVTRVTPDVETGEWDPVDKEGDLHTQPDPRMLTGTEVYREYFDMEGFTLNPHGEALRSYTALASDPSRNDYQQEKLGRLHKELTDALITDLMAPVPRRAE